MSGASFTSGPRTPNWKGSVIHERLRLPVPPGFPSACEFAMREELAKTRGGAMERRQSHR
jgi:hypothetical protein